MHPEETQKLRSYIQQSLQHGYSQEQIRQSLTDSGWPAHIVNEAFAVPAQPLQPPPAQPSVVTHKPRVNPGGWKQNLLIGTGTGIVAAIVFRLLLPSPSSQFVSLIVPTNSIFPAIIFPVLIVTFVLALVEGLVLKRFYHVEKSFRSVIYVALMGQFLAIIVIGKRILGTPYILSLPFTYLGAQFAWSFARRSKLATAAYVILVFGLLILAMRVLNTGELGLYP